MRLRGLAVLLAFVACSTAPAAVRAEPHARPPAVAACSDFGRSFFQPPGVDACVKLGARLRFDVGYEPRLVRSDAAYASSTRATLGLDARTPTQAGLISTTLRLTFERAPGSEWAGRVPDLEYAAIEWAGFTAGRATSFFDRPFSMGSATLMGGGVNGRGTDRGSVNLLAYEFAPLPGWRAGASVEDGVERRVGVAGAWERGPRWPDLVLTLAREREWGLWRTALALHQTRPDAPGRADTWGYAVQTTYDVRVPYLADTTRVRAQTSAGVGASDYTGWGYARVGAFAPRTADVWLGPRGWAAARTWASSTALIHQWTPALRVSAFTQTGVQIAWPYGPSARIWAVGANAVWRSRAGLEAGAELAFQRARLLAPPAGAPAPQPTRDSAWLARIRLQADAW
ncbi:hypothetical protein SLNSH_22425 [Alsobacter soli]|uniref:Porin n=1 Tax=Alsobacter soli TaxID=2109933 RepID=A0A2T1HMC3_9HYPH|nr:porin [Alsobacter soli]PSC02741.1 hypothetical protein SLNSH_22425 [Alsobacter soli]